MKLLLLFFLYAIALTVGLALGLRVGSFLWTVRISRADVADFMLNPLTSDTYFRSTPGVCW